MGARILAVDDEEGILRLLKRALERDGNVVDTVSDPWQLLDGKKGTDQYDLILLDVMMPGIDGFTLLGMMRDEIDCPVLFLTAKTAEEGKAGEETRGHSGRTSVLSQRKVDRVRRGYGLADVRGV